MSEVKRAMILPSGVTSKNHIGARRMTASSRWKMFFEIATENLMKVAKRSR